MFLDIQPTYGYITNIEVSMQELIGQVHWWRLYEQQTEIPTDLHLRPKPEFSDISNIVIAISNHNKYSHYPR